MGRLKEQTRPYLNEEAVRARALRLASKWDITCNLADPLSIETARLKVQNKMLRLQAQAPAVNCEDMTACMYLYQKIDSFSPDAPLYSPASRHN